MGRVPLRGDVGLMCLTGKPHTPLSLSLWSAVLRNGSRAAGRAARSAMQRQSELISVSSTSRYPFSRSAPWDGVAEFVADLPACVWL